MTKKYAEYPLVSGYIHNWLVAGPLIRWVEETAGEDWREKVVDELIGAPLEIAQEPVDREDFRDGARWTYTRCQGDHLVDLSDYAPRRCYLLGWAYTRLKAATPGRAAFTLSAYGPADVWLNGKRVFEAREISTGGALKAHAFTAELAAENELLVRFSQAGVRATPSAISLKLDEAANVSVLVPVQARFPRRIKIFEDAFDYGYLDEAASFMGQVINLRFSEGVNTELHYHYSIQDQEAMMYLDGTWSFQTDEPLDVGHPQRIFERPAYVVMHAPGKEYYEQDLRYQRRIPIYIVDNAYSSTPYGDYPSRWQEALNDASRRDTGLFSQVASMGLERWDKVEMDAIQAAIQQVKERTAGSEILLVGLLGMVERFSRSERFPKSLLPAVQACVLDYAYSANEKISGVDFNSESSQILLHAARVLAGQLYPDAEFGVECAKGSQILEQGLKQAEEWLAQVARRGFIEWNSPEALEKVVVALSHLASFAKDQNLKELAAVGLDHVIFLLAANSYRGMLPGSQGQASAVWESAALKTARLQATAGITRLLWGMGIYTARNAGTVSLALADYEFPSFFVEMALNPPQEYWSRETSGQGEAQASRALYKTPDSALGSALDYHPGERGDAQLIWQASLSEDALVFVNHPLAYCQDEARQPGYWLGNGSLPRVAQWKDTLVAVYNIPDGVGLDFTHAYFPTYSFDEYFIENGWAFGRKGDGYVALAAKNGLELLKTAPEGYRELRSPGRENTWVCLTGRVESDGNFVQFRQKVSRLKLAWGESGAELESLRGESISLSWEGAFKVDGKETALSGFPQVDNPYCRKELGTSSMDIAYGEYVVRLEFE